MLLKTVVFNWCGMGRKPQFQFKESWHSCLYVTNSFIIINYRNQIHIIFILIGSLLSVIVHFQWLEAASGTVCHLSSNADCFYNRLKTYFLPDHFLSNCFQFLVLCTVCSSGAETAAIDGLVSSWSENIFVSFCLTDTHRYVRSTRCRTSYSRCIISCSHR